MQNNSKKSISSLENNIMEIEHKEYSSIEVVNVSSTHKKKAGRRIFRETRHPVYRGVRRKSAGKWVCEVREPNKKSRIWLGTFPDPESAAVAHDVAALALRGDNAPLNFPESATCLPRAKTASHHDIQIAAVQAARDFRPSSNAWQSKTSSSSIRVSGKTKALVSKPSLSILGEKKGVYEICSDKNVDHGQEMDLERFDESGFVDEEELFNMPVLLDSMAEGMLLTPLAMKKGFNWSHDIVEDGDGLGFSLWGE